jgi:hypothetical protein
MPAYDPLRATVDCRFSGLRCPCSVRSPVVQTFSQDGWQWWPTCVTCNKPVEPVPADEDPA